MHEAGLARSVANVLRERGLRVDRIRLAVRGGHHEPAAFAREFRLYLAQQLPDEAAAIRLLDIRRIPCEHLCLACGETFDAAEPDAACPTCAGESLPAITDEQIEVELLAASPAVVPA